MSDISARSGSPSSPKSHFRDPANESPVFRVGLTVLVLGVLAVLLVAPLVVVFSEALARGWLAAVTSLSNPDAWSAIRLTLIVTAISVPLNAIFGISAAWAITKFLSLIHISEPTRPY